MKKDNPLQTAFDAYSDTLSADAAALNTFSLACADVAKMVRLAAGGQALDKDKLAKMGRSIEILAERLLKPNASEAAVRRLRDSVVSLVASVTAK